MAVSRNFLQLSRRINLRAKGITENAEKAIRRAAVAADSAAVMATPVDTGRARSGWMASIGSPSDMAPITTDTDGGSTINAARAVIETWKAGMGPIFLANNVVYIMALEQGSSAQRPEGMSQHAIAAAQSELRKVKLLGGA